MTLAAPHVDKLHGRFKRSHLAKNVNPQVSRVISRFKQKVPAKPEMLGPRLKHGLSRKSRDVK